MCVMVGCCALYYALLYVLSFLRLEFNRHFLSYRLSLSLSTEAFLRVFLGLKLTD